MWIIISASLKKNCRRKLWHNILTFWRKLFSNILFNTNGVHFHTNRSHYFWIYVLGGSNNFVFVKHHFCKWNTFKRKIIGCWNFVVLFYFTKKKPPMHLVNRKVQITVKSFQDRNFVVLMIPRSNYIILWLTLKSTYLLYYILTLLVLLIV